MHWLVMILILCLSVLAIQYFRYQGRLPIEEAGLGDAVGVRALSHGSQPVSIMVAARRSIYSSPFDHSKAGDPAQLSCAADSHSLLEKEQRFQINPLFRC